MSNAINNRYDFVFLYDVKDGNPNGDPDQANLPRVDVENQEGLVTDVCIKRKVRNYVQLKHDFKSPYNIFIRQGTALNTTIEAAKGEKLDERQKDLCKDFYDIRTFGAVMSTGKNPAGTVRGPVQFTFSRSEDRIYQAEHSLTRCAVTTEEDAKKQEGREFASTFGRKATVPYALYRMHGFVSAVDAGKSGFTEEDLELLWEALLNAFEHDRAAARGEMNPRKLIIFKHQSHLGNARSGELFERVTVEKQVELPRKWSDYLVDIDKNNLPTGIELIEKL
ncbi:type I-C CRISPR-associated protein Cas7/Csd2 [Desulfovibrio litoralis]|uniref:CRISPR-associated protein, Csd2 family n=1 Tax=Desulfovibrio litoralis DSM 11393 TaxID=1121455 RepID=A0A1M7TR73_9BACT|nr:type I-C CRISPR-associated protein Cas7/Csd2 [Desulfovibrio litoralis]SHN73249.1 CRISPR-associated protein, Csd2 family [Desulfovibrio litoralis DSM 11393]